VLREPSPAQHIVMQELARLPRRLVVMSRHSAELLTSVYQVDPKMIDIIPHGIPSRLRPRRARIGSE
jgi:hypothetical protein